MRHRILRERPLEYLRRRADGESFPEQTVRNWYVARAFVLDKLKDYAVRPDSPTRFEASVEGDSPLMIAVLRQLALSAHFANYEEYDIFGRLTCRNRSILTLLSSNESIVWELSREENLGNLLQYCKYSLFGEEHNPDAYLDLEIRIVKQLPDVAGFGLRITEDDVKSFEASANPDDVFTIDTRKAVLASRVYELGAVIDNVPAEDIHSAHRYLYALDTFKYKLLEKKISPLVNEDSWKQDLRAVKNGLSNIMCVDCFESRALGIKRYAKERHISERAAWEENNGALSCSEHNRWVTEKLILGYRPISAQERLEYQSCFGKSKAAYARQLKNNVADPSHVDLCSYLDLRRGEPNDLKYDSFLLLAIPAILKKVK